MKKVLPATGLCVLVSAGVVMAGPALPITKPPVAPGVSNTGPLVDPHATRGQWFRSTSAGTEEVRPYEFYDNLEGGGWKSWGAILGKTRNIQTNASGNIVAFDIDATITNDLPSSGQWLPGTNSHGETLTSAEPYSGDMFDVKLTADFAIDAFAFNAWGGSGDPAYRDTSPHAVAQNHDQLAWYCWTPVAGQNDPGDYLVPTWDFGDIPLGGSATRTLQFTVDGVGYAPGSQTANFISSGQTNDVLLNRTTSLKISTWIDDLAMDPGTPYPADPPLRSSDVSVFFDPVPEPTSVLLVLGGLVGLLRQRR